MSGRITSRGKPKSSIRMVIRRVSSRMNRGSLGGIPLVMAGIVLTVGAFTFSVELLRVIMLIAGLSGIILGAILYGLWDPKKKRGA